MSRYPRIHAHAPAPLQTETPILNVDADLARARRPGHQLQHVPAPLPARRSNRTGLPDAVKAGAESLSEMSLDDVRVHYNSDRPARLMARAYTQGTEIHVAPGQEQHVPHEAWHVVQQMQGRVRSTAQMKGVGLNDDASLEREADAMGAKAARGDVGRQRTGAAAWPAGARAISPAVQRVILPVGDLEQLAYQGHDLTEDEKKSAGVISTAVKSWSEAQDPPERIVRPWATKTLFSRGGLRSLESKEPLVIMGHGEKYDTEDVTLVGGYTPKELSKLLTELDLPKTYAGEIYISGCQTARSADGARFGFLGKFYDEIVKRAPAVSVKGNIFSVTTEGRSKEPP